LLEPVLPLKLEVLILIVAEGWLIQMAPPRSALFVLKLLPLTVSRPMLRIEPPSPRASLPEKVQLVMVSVPRLSMAPPLDFA